MNTKEKLTNEFFDKLGKIGNITNPLLISKEFNKLELFIHNIYDNGYKEGFEEGKKEYIKIKSS